MWIITAMSGVINTDQVTRFTENNYGTHAYCNGSSYTLSSDHVLDTIVGALRNHDDFVEVK